MRGTSNSNVRGSSKDRARRRQYLVRTYEADVAGKCRCYRCGALLTEETVTVDRIVPGCLGGRYVRENIRPACSACNTETGSTLGVQRRGLR
jgi:5-methylcytosine-specific restriction endonuclease McrA